MLIFIITFARTGGMILCETIGQHPEILTLNEVANWRERIKEGKNAVIKLWIRDMFHPIKKTDIFNQFPDAKFISVNRNPRDLSASLKALQEVGRPAKNFLTHVNVHKHNIWIEGAVQYKEFLNWRKTHENNPNLMVINFNDLILKKHETFKKIFKWIGLEITDEISNYINKFISNQPIKNYPGQAWSMSRKTKVGNYKEILTEDEIKIIDFKFSNL